MRALADSLEDSCALTEQKQRSNRNESIDEAASRAEATKVGLPSGSQEGGLKLPTASSQHTYSSARRTVRALACSYALLCCPATAATSPTELYNCAAVSLPLAGSVPSL